MNADPYGSRSTALGLTMLKFDQVKEAVNNWHCEEFVSRREQNKIKYTTPKIIRIPALKPSMSRFEQMQRYQSVF